MVAEGAPATAKAVSPSTTRDENAHAQSSSAPASTVMQLPLLSIVGFIAGIAPTRRGRNIS
jgi:hypothetical protein